MGPSSETGGESSLAKNSAAGLVGRVAPLLLTLIATPILLATFGRRATA
jgi:hypothetical protein